MIERFLLRLNEFGDAKYANRPRGMRRQAEPAAAGAPAIVPAPRLAPTEATRRWAALLQQIFEVDPLACPTCRGPMRIIAFITTTSVIARSGIAPYIRRTPIEIPIPCTWRTG